MKTEEAKSVPAPIQRKVSQPRHHFKQENRIKMRITSLAKMRSVDDNSEQLAEKAELISRLSETSENNLFAQQHPDFIEKSAVISLAAQKAVQRLLESSESSSNLADGNANRDATSTPAIAFKRKKINAGNRHIRSRTDDD